MPEAASIACFARRFNKPVQQANDSEGLPLRAEELKRPERFSNPALIETILREGVRL